MTIHFFDPNREFDVTVRKLPHWEQAGVICFITWRTWDSLPAIVINRWLEERDNWLTNQGVDPKHIVGCDETNCLPPELKNKYQSFVSSRWQNHLDDCHGSCPLRDQAYAKIVFDSLLHFHCERYWIDSFVIMPNHIHLLASFPNEGDMRKQCYSWKKWTGTKLNSRLLRRGRFWQTESFDHLVRSEEHLEYFRNYIKENPINTKLTDTE